MKKITYLLILVTFMTGCSAAQTTKNVNRFNNPDEIVISDLRSARQNGIMVVQATLNNTNKYDTSTVLYRFKWVDNAGFVAAEEAWKPQVIYAGQSLQLKGVAPSPSITDFKIELSQK